MENLREHNIKLPVIAGIRPLTNFKQAESVENFFKLKVDDKLKNGLKDKTDKEAYKFGINYTVDMIKKLKEYCAPGVHLFVLKSEYQRFHYHFYSNFVLFPLPQAPCKYGIPFSLKE